LYSKALAFSAASPWNSADESADQAGDLRPAVGIELSRFFWDRERASCGFWISRRSFLSSLCRALQQPWLANSI